MAEDKIGIAYEKPEKEPDYSGYGNAAAGLISRAPGLIASFSKSGRRLKRRQFGLQETVTRANLDALKASLAYHGKYDPEDVLRLKESMRGRGLGKSTINDYFHQKLLDQQKLRIDALKAKQEQAAQGLDLVMQQQRYSARMRNMKYAQVFLIIAGGIVGISGGPAGVAAGVGAGAAGAAALGGE